MSIVNLKRSLPQRGMIKWLGVRPEKKADLLDIKTLYISKVSAIEGDDYQKDSENRMVTLIQAEHITVGM